VCDLEDVSQVFIARTCIRAFKDRLAILNARLAPFTCNATLAVGSPARGDEDKYDTTCRATSRARVLASGPSRLPRCANALYNPRDNPTSLVMFAFTPARVAAFTSGRLNDNPTRVARRGNVSRTCAMRVSAVHATTTMNTLVAERSPIAQRRCVIVEKRARGEAERPRGRIVAKASESSEGMSVRTKTAVYFFLWYFFNIVFNVYNKSTLNVFPYPWLISTLQLAATSLWMLTVWVTKVQPVPVVSKLFLIAVAPVAFFHTVGHVSACVSFSKMAVSFTHVVKAAEPVFSVILSGPLLGQTFSPAVWASLLPIVIGCSMAAMKEVSFNITGFQGAMISNVAMVLRNITSKKSLNDFKNIDGINLYGILGIIGLLYLAPAAILVEGSQWSAGYAAAVAKVGEQKLWQMLFLSGIFYHLYNQVSYQALANITPVTFSVGNSLKRVAVIVASVLYFKNPVSPLNAAGSALALVGAYLYTKATEKPKSGAAATTKSSSSSEGYSAYNDAFRAATGLSNL